MSIQLTPEQTAEIKRLVKLAGGSVIFPKPKAGAVAKCKPDHLEAQITRLRGMTFKTAGVKSSLISNLKNAIKIREFHRAHPVDLSDALAMFGVKLRDVSPWPDAGEAQRGQCLANGLPTGRLALPSPASFGAGWEPDAKVYNLAPAAAPITRIVCSK
jgi:hypothetical protein